MKQNMNGKNVSNGRVVNRIIKTLWMLTFVVIFLMCFCVFAISQGWFGKVPPISDLQNPIDKYASRVYSADDKLIGTWSYATTNRITVPYDSLPDYLIHALVATEDVRFYEHSGIDARALVRAVVKRLIMKQKSAGGGSTITQQLAKQLYSDVARDERKRMMQKPIEWYIAVQLERHYTKEEIIAMYLNQFDFLRGGVGIKNAAMGYFGKLPIDLTLEECAMFIGMCKNPSLYNPYVYDNEARKLVVNPRCKERRDVVLAQMAKAGYITEEEKEQAQAKEIKTNSPEKIRVADHKEGEAQYFREYLRRIMMAKRPDRSNYASWQGQQYSDDSLAWETNPLYGWCNKNTKRDGSHYNIYTDGLKVYTTIDTKMQKMAEDALFEHLAKYLQPNFDREIKGSKIAPYKNLTVSKVNEIINRNIRQSERYRVLKAAGWTEEKIMADFNKPVEMTVFTYGNSYRDSLNEKLVTMSPRDSIIYYKKFLRGSVCAIDPTNGHIKAYVPGINFKYFMFDNVLGGGHRQVGSTIKPLLYSLALSKLDYTPCDIVDATPRNYGGWTPKGSSLGRVAMKTALANSNNHASVYLLDKIRPQTFIKFLRDKMKISSYSMSPNLTLALGSCDVSVGEMASAYTTFPGMGVHYSPTLVTRIEDSEGNIVASFSPRINEVLSKEKAYQMLDMLQAVINQGTGRALRGSTYNITAQLGGKTGTTNNNADGWFIGFCPKLVVACWVGGDDRDIHFGSMAFGQGARAALPIFGKLMNKIYKQSYLGITQKDSFDIPKNYVPCHTELDNLPSADAILNPKEQEEADIDLGFF